MVNIYFSDFYNIDPTIMESHGALNISLVSDLPLFVDPFLLFHSDNSDYQKLHETIIDYVRFLRDRSAAGLVDQGLLSAWFHFGEIKENWLGYSENGNAGRGLGGDFAKSLHENLYSVFSDFGKENITKGSHLEKLCLVSKGVGRDNISDFATNLIQGFLLEYTQSFAVKYLRSEQRREFAINKVRFNYKTETWESGRFELPVYRGKHVILTPKDILTREDIWISRRHLAKNFENVAVTIPNEQLRSQINNYFSSLLHKDRRDGKVSREERDEAVGRVVRTFPVIIEYFIREREDHGDEAIRESDAQVAEVQQVLIDQVHAFVRDRLAGTSFYQHGANTYQESHARLAFLKDVIENKDGYRIFYSDGKPIKRESDLQILFRLTWHGSPSDVNREVNNGRGPVDFKIARGSSDKCLVEFKLASNSHLKRNLENQVDIYRKASDANRSIKAIIYFTEKEQQKVESVMRDLGLLGVQDIVLIDARSDNKPAASKA